MAGICRSKSVKLRLALAGGAATFTLISFRWTNFPQPTMPRRVLQVAHSKDPKSDSYESGPFPSPMRIRLSQRSHDRGNLVWLPHFPSCVSYIVFPMEGLLMEFGPIVVSKAYQ